MFWRSRVMCSRRLSVVDSNLKIKDYTLKIKDQLLQTTTRHCPFSHSTNSILSTTALARHAAHRCVSLFFIVYACYLCHFRCTHCEHVLRVLLMARIVPQSLPLDASESSVAAPFSVRTRSSNTSSSTSISSSSNTHTSINTSSTINTNINNNNNCNTNNTDTNNTTNNVSTSIEQEVPAPTEADLVLAAKRAAPHRAAWNTINEEIPFKTPNGTETLLRIFVGTWNLHGKPIPDNLSEFVQLGYDIYCIGTQECERSIEASFLFSGKVTWVSALVSRLGDEYAIVAQCTLQAIHQILFARKSLIKHMTKIETATVATGIGDVVGNKGGIGIGCNIGHASFLFINSHFSAHQHKTVERNIDYKRIQTKLPFRFDAKKPNVSDRFDHVFWSGDLNYRVNANRKMADALLRNNMMEVMIANDQLCLEREAREVFHGFIEGPLSFLPTFKYNVNSHQYDTSVKQRVPSWTDRILFKPNNALKLIQYDCCQNITSSDHRPVYATFEARVQLQMCQNEFSSGDITSEKSSQVCVIM